MHGDGLAPGIAVNLAVAQTVADQRQFRVLAQHLRRFVSFINKDIGGFLTETPLSTDQTVKDSGDDYEISATVIESQMLEWWFKSTLKTSKATTYCA